MTETIEKADELVDRAEINGGTVLVEYSRTEAALADLRAKYQGATYDLTTTAGDKAARAARLELVSLRTGLEKKRKELKAPAVEFGKRIDEEAKRITGEIVALEEPIDKQIKADEARREAERLERERLAAERAAGFRAKIDAIRACVAKAQGLNSERIGNGIAQVEAIAIDAEAWAEFAEEAAHAKSTTLAAMLNLRDAAKAREDEAARLEAQRLENERIAAEQRAAAEALAAQQRALAEQAAAIAAQQKALDEAKAEAERKEREAAEASERAAAEAKVEAPAAPAENPATTRVCGDFEPASAPAAAGVQQAAAAAPAGEIRQIHPAAAALRNEQPTLTLGAMKDRLGFALTADFLAQLGFEAMQVKSARLYRESEWPDICAGISAHVLACAKVREAA